MSRAPQQAARLPASEPAPGSRGRDRLRGFVALLATLALVFAVPWALWTYGGAPWPTSAPSMQWLTQPIDAGVIVQVLFFVLWLAWAHFVLCLLVEVRAERRGYGLTTQVPGGGVGTQSLARRLVASVLLLVGSAAVTVPAATAATGIAQTETVSASVQAKSAAHAETPRSERTLGKTAEAEASNQTKAVAKGSRITYTVHPPKGRNYDSLWDIAERYLGDGRRYKEIYDLNKGKLQADGRTLREADLIYPGWVMTLPDDAKGPGLNIREEQAPPARPSGGPHAGSSAGDGPGAEGSGDAAPATAGGVGGGEASASSGLLQYGVGGALVAAGLVAGLLRRRGWNGGGADALSPEDELPLRLAADDRQARFVDRALRGLAHALQREGRAMPSVYAAYLHGDLLSLALSPAVADDPPPGWTTDDGGRLWSTDRDTADAMQTPADVLAPYPGLVTAGTLDDGTLVLLELETAPGLVALGGHLDTAREVGVSLAVELATNLWSDEVSVTLVGFGDDLTELAPRRARRIDNVDEILDDLEQHRMRQHGVCVRDGLDSVIRGRQTRPDRELWKPQFIVLSGVPTQEQLTRLSELAADPRHAVGVVTIGDVVNAPWRMVVSDQGQLTNPLLGLELEAQRLSVGAYTKVLELFRKADAERRIGPTDLEPATVPGFDPRLLDLERPAAVSVRLLGPTQVDAPGELAAERRELATEIVTYVALHPEGVHPGVLDSAIWPRGVTEEVRNGAIGHVQRWLGENASGEPRLDLDEAGRWRLDLTSVRVDWHAFQGLFDRAHHGAHHGAHQGTHHGAHQGAHPGGDATDDLTSAVSMLRGRVLSELPAHRYSWLSRSTHVRDITVTVVEATRQLAELATSIGQPALAREALRTGLLVAPDCEQLWRDLLQLAAGSVDELGAVVAEMYTAIAEHGSPRGATAETDALVDELLPGYRTRVA